jgi:hypothetical protein
VWDQGFSLVCQLDFGGRIRYPLHLFLDGTGESFRPAISRESLAYCLDGIFVHVLAEFARIIEESERLSASVDTPY